MKTGLGPEAGGTSHRRPTPTSMAWLFLAKAVSGIGAGAAIVGTALPSGGLGGVERLGAADRDKPRIFPGHDAGLPVAPLLDRLAIISSLAGHPLPGSAIRRLDDGFSRLKLDAGLDLDGARRELATSRTADPRPVATSSRTAGATSSAKRRRSSAEATERMYALMPVESVSDLVEASRVFERYADERRIARLYVAPEDVDRARRILGLPVFGD